MIFVSQNCHDKTVIRFGFCDILNSQGLGKCYQPWPSAWLIALTSNLIISDITKASSNNLFIIATLGYYGNGVIDVVGGKPQILKRF